MQQEVSVSGLPLPVETSWVPLSACTSLLKCPSSSSRQQFLACPHCFQWSQHSGDRQTCSLCVPAEPACSTKLLHRHI